MSHVSAVLFCVVHLLAVTQATALAEDNAPRDDANRVPVATDRAGAAGTEAPAEVSSSTDRMGTFFYEYADRTCTFRYTLHVPSGRDTFFEDGSCTHIDIYPDFNPPQRLDPMRAPEPAEVVPAA